MPREVSSRQSSARLRRGFTLVEVVATLLVIGILAAAAAPRYTDAKLRFQVKAAAQHIRSDLELARSTARVAGVTTSATFDVAANRYTLSGVTHLDRSGTPYIIDLALTGYAASLASVALGPSGTATAISFDMHGRPDAGGTIVVSTGSEQRTLQIDAITGRITIQ